MKKTLLVLIAAAGTLSAQDNNPIQSALIPPELLIQRAAEIGLSEADRAAITQILTTSRPEIEALQGGQRAASDTLAKALEAQPVDVPAILEKFDAMLAAESAMKRKHLETMLTVRNKLTPEQFAKVTEMRKAAQLTPEEQVFVRSQIQPKMEMLNMKIRELQKAGTPPGEETGKHMRDFQLQMQTKKLEEALKTLETALEKLK